jgi:hypothetical protein
MIELQMAWQKTCRRWRFHRLRRPLLVVRGKQFQENQCSVKDERLKGTAALYDGSNLACKSKPQHIIEGATGYHAFLGEGTYCKIA